MTILAAALVQVSILGLLHPSEITVEQGTRTTKIRNAETRVEANGQTFDRFEIKGDFRIRIEPDFQRAYRGTLTVTANKSDLELLLTAEVEDLVAATVTAESPPNAPPAALAAQAILARSWIAASRGRHGRFDLCDTTHCQHFKEASPAGREAARATRGLVLAWQDKPFAPAYSASCGGRTQTAAAIGWNDENAYPYFAVECSVCRREEPEWTRHFSPEVAALLRARPHAESVRLALGRQSGWDTLPSNNYEATETPQGLEVKGHGHGHGLGYCQRGGAGLARQGLTPAAILRHYFPGTVIISSR